MTWAVRGMTAFTEVPTSETTGGQMPQLDTARPIRVLIVDGDERLRRSFVAALCEGGHTAVGADDGACGLDVLATEVFELAFVDMVRGRVRPAGAC